MSAHSTMMGSQYRDNQSVAAMSRKEGSMYSGRASNFNRGKQTRFNLKIYNKNNNGKYDTFSTTSQQHSTTIVLNLVSRQRHNNL